MKTFWTKWMMSKLTKGNKQGANDSEQCNKTKFCLVRYVTLYKTWLQYFTLESNGQSVFWTADEEGNPKREKPQHLASKVMATAFCDGKL